MILPPIAERQPPQEVVVPYSWIAKVLRIPIFRLALGDDRFSRVVMAVYRFFSGLFQGQPFRNFDPAVAERSLNRFIVLGAEVRFVVPRDGRGRVQMMTFRADALRQRIQALGGSWERRDVQGREVFAIVPPEHPNGEWVEFKEKLGHFRWREADGVIITCDAAEAIPPDEPTRCFVHAHSTSISFISDWRRAGYYLGAQQDFCFFDNGNTWENQGRPVSEQSFYLEADTVLERLIDHYPIDRLWVGGSCGGAPIGGYLKMRHHGERINFYAEQSFSDLRHFVSNPVVAFLTPRVKGSLASAEDVEDIPTSQFSVARLWGGLQLQDRGKVILVEVENDEHISRDAYQEYLDLAGRVNANVTHVVFASNAAWRHADDFFRHEEPRRQFWAAVFG